MACRPAPTITCSNPLTCVNSLARLHTLLRRVAGRSVNLIEHGALTYDPSSRETMLAGQPVDLSRREQSLLQALLHNRGRVLSTEQLKDSVYGFNDELESNALNVHIHHLRRKLGNGIVETVRGLGYRLGPADGGEATEVMSLRLRLSLTLGAAFALIWALAAAWMLSDLRNQMMFSLDQRLVASARMVAGLLEQLPPCRAKARAPISAPSN